MNDAFALRIDIETRAKLARLAKRLGVTRSDLVRDAIAARVREEERRLESRPYDLVRDLLGSVHGGDPGRSSLVGRKVARKLRERRRGR